MSICFLSGQPIHPPGGWAGSRVASREATLHQSFAPPASGVYEEMRCHLTARCCVAMKQNEEV